MSTLLLSEIIAKSPSALTDASKRLEIAHIDKSSWGQGEWQEEPDLILWQDAHSGLFAMASRDEDFGNLCGYVAVPPGHRLHGADLCDSGLTAYGGVNFSSSINYPESKHAELHQAMAQANLWWFGFDCMQALNDIYPGMQGPGIESSQGNTKQMKTAFQNLQRSNGATYKNTAFVMNQCEMLAAQLSQ